MTQPMADTSMATDVAHPLLLLRLLPELGALGRWAAAARQRALSEDTGYALHAALRAVLGDLAPKPFALVARPDGLQLLGYTSAAESELEAAFEGAEVVDTGAARALGLAPRRGALVRAMTHEWRVGQELSFEARVAPVVRSRACQTGSYPEVDAAFHPDYAGTALGDREAAHRRWVARELARAGAATLIRCRAVAFQLAPIARRAARADRAATGRRTSLGLLPDLTVRGQLRIDDPQAFQRLLARGLGRHRAFGFGCLLLAPPGAWR